MDNCTLDCIQIMGNFTTQETCQFVQESCLQDSVQFIQAYYCLIHQSFILFAIIAILLFVLLYLALNSLTEHSLTPCVQNVISRFKISPTLAGVTFLAFSNGAPDVLTAVLAGASTSRSTELIPFGSIFGASLFSTAFILSAVIFNSPNQRLKVKKKQILVPLAFYIIDSSLTSSKVKKKRREEQANALSSQLLQSIELKKSQSIQQKQTDNLNFTQIQFPQNEQKDEQSIQINPLLLLIQKISNFYEKALAWIIPPRDIEEWNPLRSLVSFILSPFIIALSQDISGCFTNNLLSIPIIAYLCVPAIPFIINTLICWVKGWKPKDSAFYTLYSFLLTIAWLTLIVGLLINLLQLVQLLTNINPIFLGMTCLAWANCIGDYLSITMFARRGRAQTAVSGIFSGQLFNFLIGFGSSLLIQSKNGEQPFEIFSFTGAKFDIISDSIAALIITSGLFYFSFVFYKVFSSKGIFKIKQGIIFRSIYCAVLIIAICLAISADFFREVNCDY